MNSCYAKNNSADNPKAHDHEVAAELSKISELIYKLVFNVECWIFNVECFRAQQTL